MNRQNRNASRINVGLAPLLSGLSGLTGLRGLFSLAPPVRALLLCPIVGAGLFLVLAATMAEEKLNFLSVGTAHVASLRGWSRAVKRSTMPFCRNPAARGN